MAQSPGRITEKGMLGTVKLPQALFGEYTMIIEAETTPTRVLLSGRSLPGAVMLQCLRNRIREFGFLRCPISAAGFRCLLSQCRSFLVANIKRVVWVRAAGQAAMFAESTAFTLALAWS